MMKAAASGGGGGESGSGGASAGLECLTAVSDADHLADATAKVTVRDEADEEPGPLEEGDMSPTAAAAEGAVGESEPGMEAWASAASLGQTPVVVVRGVDEAVPPEGLCQLFGVYGDVVKIKLAKSKGTGLVEMRHIVQADNARRYLDGVMLAGRNVHVDLSTNSCIKDPNATNFLRTTQVHRFASVTSPMDARYQEHLTKPGATLVIDNLPPDCQREDLAPLLRPYGVVALDIEQQVSQAVVQMEAVDAAVTALIMVHNRKLKGHALRVLFFNRTYHGTR